MTRLFAEGKLRAGDVYIPEREQQHYLRDVLRLHGGDRVIVVDGEGSEFDALIQRRGRSKIHIEIERALSKEGAAVLRIHLLVGLVKGKKIERVIRDATELGVESITPFISERTVARDVSVAKVERLHKIAREEARLSGRTRMPRIFPPVPLSLAVEGVEGEKLIFWEGGGRGVREYLRNRESVPDAVSICTGPEGGFSDREIKRAEENGFTVLDLGTRILRAEVAPAVATVLVQYEWGDLSIR
jgi:16S rRNA (uracil1498-N3)-methyltransferase